MEEMHRTHKEPVWGWVTIVADLITKSRDARVADKATRSIPTPRRRAVSVVTPWSPRSPAGWSA
jgi:hypothetical protein